MIEDTTFVIDVLQGDEGAIEMLDRIEEQHIPEKLSSITVLKIFEGIQRSDYPESDKEKVKSILTSKHIVRAGEEIMKVAGNISGRLYREGRPIDREDCIVAATSLHENEPVITRNIDHFERVPEVSIERY